MSGWEPGWPAAGGDARPPEQANGMPGPAAEQSPSEQGWQDGGLRDPLGGVSGWGGEGQLAGQYNLNQVGAQPNAKAFHPSNPSHPHHPSSTQTPTTTSASIPPINTNFLPRLDHSSSSFDNSPVDLPSSGAFGSAFDLSHPPSGTHSRQPSQLGQTAHSPASALGHATGSSGLLDAYAQSGYPSAHPFLPTSTSSAGPSRYIPNASHYRSPYAQPAPVSLNYYNWPGGQYQPQPHLQSNPYAAGPASYASPQASYGYPVGSNPTGPSPDQHQWRPSSSSEEAQRLPAGGAGGNGGRGGWSGEQSAAEQGPSWIGSSYSLTSDPHAQPHSQGRYSLPAQSLSSSTYRPGSAVDSGISPRSVPSRLRSIDEFDHQPLSSQPHLASTSSQPSPVLPSTQPSAYSSFYGGQQAAQAPPHDRSDSSSLRRSGTAKRSRTSTDSTGSAAKASAPAGGAGKGKKAAAGGAADGPPKRKLTVDLEAKCGTCGVALARLICRGSADDMAVPHKAVFTCLDCTPNAKPISNKRPSAVASTSKSKSKTVQPLLNTSTSVNTFRKRNKKSFSDPSALTPCDVCLRDIATGAVLADDGESEIGFTVEVVCVRCDERYMRCSDCGGGGGSRLGAGKWRCRELFVPGRKTCKLSHDRLGNLNEMDYDVHAIRDVPPAEMGEIIRQSETIFKNTLIAGMCIPEVLETGSAPFKSYEDIIQMTENGWRGIQQLFTVDIEPSRSIRRYIGLRSTTPNPRKSQRARAAEAERPFQQGGVVLRANKDIVGFVLAEYDFLIGSLFLAVVVPWGTADTFDATTRMLVALIARVEEDLREMNAFNERTGVARLPEVKQIWTLMFFKRESRMMAHLEKKRGFVPLNEYLAKWADSSAAEFAPERECYIPRERQTDEWHVVVKRQLGVDDWTRATGAIRK